MRVVIIGSGLGGLCLAQGLARAGIETVVHERDPAIDARRQGYRIHIDGRGAEALHACLPAELYELFLATANLPGRQMAVVTKQLRQLHAIRFPKGDRSQPAQVNTAVDRAVLRTLLLCGLEEQGVAVRFGSEFVRYRTDPVGDGAGGPVTAVFADGSEDSGDLLVAADGVGSRIREQYLPHARVRDTGDRTLYGRTPLTDAVRAQLPEVLSQGFTAVVGSRRLGMAVGLVDFAELPDAAAARLWPAADFKGVEPYVMWALAGQGRAFPADDRMRALEAPGLHQVALGMVRGWHGGLRALVADADPAATFYLDIRTSVPVGPWPASRVTLLGDAIHAMPPSRGSGANIALKDAGRLCAELAATASGEGPLIEAVGRYEADMVAYGFAAVGDALAAVRQGGGLVGALASLLRRRH